MRASIENRFSSELNWSFDMAPVVYPRCAIRLAKILSNVLIRHESREIGRRFLGSEVSVRPGLGIGTHLASFYAGGKTRSTEGLRRALGGWQVRLSGLLPPFCN